MNRAAVAATGLFFLLGAAASKQQADPSPYEKIVVELLASVKKMSVELKKIKDEDTAKNAAAPLEKAVKEFLSVRQAAGNLKQPDKAEKERVTEKYQKPLADAVKNLRAEIKRVQRIPGGREALNILKKALKPPNKKE